MAFMVFEGELTIDFHDGAARLSPAEMYVVPVGVEHRPRADTGCPRLLVEPRGVVNTGGAGGAFTAVNDEWV